MKKINDINIEVFDEFIFFFERNQEKLFEEILDLWNRLLAIIALFENECIIKNFYYTDVSTSNIL